MAHQIKKIQINNPCHENWDGMGDATGGRYCMSCQKHVVDFSKFSNRQILEYLSKSGNTCGKFGDFQMEGFNNYLSVSDKPAIPFRKWGFAAILLGWLPFINTQAKAKPVIEQHQVPFKNKLAVRDTTKLITGTVKDYNGMLGGATISAKGTNIVTTTNEIGYFRLNVPANANTIVVNLKGYEPTVFSIAPGKKMNYNIVLVTAAPKLMSKTIPPSDLQNEKQYFRLPLIGGIVITSAPPDNTARMWYNIWTK